MSSPPRSAVLRARTVVRELIEQADRALAPGVYVAISVSAVRTRTWLRGRGLPFLDPEAPAPRHLDVARTADHVIAQSRSTSAALGAVTGVAGWLGIPTEVAGWAVAHLRLAQRLSVVYGFDPMSDRGHAAVSRALAAGLEVDLPEEGVVGTRVSDVVRPALDLAPPDLATLRGALVRRVIRSAVRVATRRAGRVVPVLAAGVSAVDNHAITAEVGERMKAVLQRLAEAPAPDHARLVEAIEVGSGEA
ncbi:MAG: EcsC family protein [Alphaproteobacteria bacterium]|nr:EcsC family protein [Alphaproteobacteria bacterium]